MRLTSKILIHADPGARANFIAAWLSDCLDGKFFDVGLEADLGQSSHFVKIHGIDNMHEIESFTGSKIRVRPSMEGIDLQCLLYLKKVVYDLLPAFTKDEYSLECFSKMYAYAQEVLHWDTQLDYSLYDYIIDFKATYNLNAMMDIYHKIHSREPQSYQIGNLIRTNQKNLLIMDNNHCCKLVQFILSHEKMLGVEETNRLWSIVDIFNNIPIHSRFDTLSSYIRKENYLLT